MSFTENVYRFECDNTIVGKLEDIVLDLLNWRILKHTENGNFIAPNKNTNEVFSPSSLIGIKWEYADTDKQHIMYRFYVSFGDKITFIDEIANDALYIQENGDILGYGYRFGRLAFTYKGYRI